jgi:hypothetical protein
LSLDSYNDEFASFQLAIYCMIFCYFAEYRNVYGQCSMPFSQPGLYDSSSFVLIGLKPKINIKNYSFPPMSRMAGIYLDCCTVDAS